MPAPGIWSRAPAALAVLAALAGLLACQRPAHERAVVLSFVEPPVERLHDPGDLLRESEVASWDLTSAEELAAWQPGGPGAILERGASTRLTGSARHRSMLRPVALRADGVQAIDLTLGRNRGLSVTLEWAAPGQPLSAERSLRVRAIEMPPGRFPTVRFPVGEHPDWSGTIGSLRLSFAVPKARPVILSRLAGLAIAPDPAARAGALGRPWLVDLGGETRSALLVPPEAPVERSLTVPDGAVLEAVYGVTASGPPFELRAVFADDDGGEEVLFSRTVGWREAGTWHALEVRLDRLAGRRGRLRLASEPAGGPAGRALLADAALPAWGHPEVLAPAPDPAAERPPNVVLISLDTLRADRLSLYGNPRPTSPRLEEWAERRAVVFEQAVAAAPWTLPAHTTMFTGLDAHRHGVNYWSPVPDGLTTVAERFQAQGWRTLAVTGGSFLTPRFGLLQGFDAVHYFTGEHRTDPGELAAGVRRAVAWIEAHRDRPFFLLFHSYETHAPYRPRQPWFDRFAAGRPEELPEVLVGPAPAGLEPGSLARSVLQASPLERGQPAPAVSAETLPVLAAALYDSTVAFTDQQVGEILEALRRLGLERRTAVVITSDHGELLGEHGLAGHAYLYDENLMVPLLVSAPDGRGAGRRVARQVRQADVAATVLALAGLDPAAPGGPAGPIDGRSLLPWLGDDPPEESAAAAVSYAPRSGRGASLRLDGRAKYVLRTGVWPPAAGRGLFFDLRRDPDELEPEIDGAEPLRHRLVTELERAYAGLYLTVANAGPARLDVDLAGEMLSRFGIQSLDLACDCVRQSGPSAVLLAVPPGERFTLRLEHPQGSHLEVAAEIRGAGAAGRAEARYEIAELGRPAGLRWEEGRWRPDPIEPERDLGPGREPAVTGLTLGWAGEADRGARAPATERDARLLRQLRALGYVE